MNNNFTLTGQDVDVSVIILTYNHEKYIEQCLKSVLSQKFNFKTEIIIGDDCSTDKTQELLLRYKRKYPFLQLVLRQSNIGATRNAFDLSSRMRGKYYAYLEGDDFWCDDRKLEIQYNFMRAHPELSGCYHDIKIVDEKGNPIYRPLFWVTQKKRFTLHDFDGIKLPGHSSSWMRKNLFATGDIDFTSVFKFNRNIGDRTIALIFLANGDFAKVGRAMSVYRCARGRKSKSLTSVVYSGVTAYSTEYALAELYEEYCADAFGKALCIEKRKNEIICDTLVYLMRKHDSEARKLLKVYMSKSRNRFLTVLSIPLNVVKKVFSKAFFVR